MRGADEHDDPPVTTRRRPFSLSRAQRISGEGELIARVGTSRGGDVQLDISAFLVGADDQVVFGDRYYFVYYNNHLSTDRSTRFLDDPSDGSAVIRTQLNEVDAAVRKIIFAVTIYDADVLGHAFGLAADALFTVEGEFVNRPGLGLLQTDNLSRAFPEDSAVVIGEVYRSARSWEYRRLGAGHTYPGLLEIGRTYGVRFDA